ncbi:hypothetical protein BaRGS_00023863 [Batillaria attramentaria]|uniref:Uncharacterized protein n=1 Tax=Batillaria attramentaria TaxID=370345 RepID=A0ABD0KCT5_9CAEN
MIEFSSNAAKVYRLDFCFCVYALWQTSVILLVLGFLAAERRAEAAQCACATTALHVRDGPGTSHKILHTMAVGECLHYNGDHKDANGYTWFHLTYNGHAGWAANEWLHVSTCAGTHAAGCPKIISRSEWGARAPSHHIGNMSGKPIYVFIHHGTGAHCHDKASCERIVRGYQNYHMDTHGWSDIGYNFVVGEDGNAYAARGWNEIGAHTYGYNSNGIAICIIGDFTSRVPNDAALHTVRQLIQCGLDHGHISPSYTLKGHRDVGQTACPGDALYHLIHSWPHYKSGTQLYG